MSEYLKNPFARSLTEAIGKGAADALQLTGKALPVSMTARVSPAVVRVKFEMDASPFTLPEIEVPLFGAQFVRLPLQVGQPGLLVPAAAYISELCGLGGGTPDLTQPANLGAVAFLPLANADWSASDPDTLRLYGFTALRLEDSDGGDAYVTLTAEAATLGFGDNSIEVTADGVNINGDFSINGEAYLDHMHDGVTAGSDSTGGVVE